MAKANQTIQEIKSKLSNILHSSPRKIAYTLRCAVLTKSELKTTSNGNNMFTMTLCDENPEHTIKAVSFHKDLYELLNPTETYIIKKFKAKNDVGNKIQIHLDTGTEIERSATQIKIEKKTFNIAQILRKETSNITMLNIKCKIAFVDEPLLVGKVPNQFLKRDIICQDNTGQITLVLWRDRAKNFYFKSNEVISIENVVSSSFQNKINITSTQETIIKTINDESLEQLQVETQNAQPEEYMIKTFNSKIFSIKEFKVTTKCVNCHKWITVDDDSIIECQACSAMFPLQHSNIHNECAFMLEDKQYYTARTNVSIVPIKYI